MGSFSYTCCLSNLPIEYGDDVRFFLLSRNPFYEEAHWTTAPTDLWVPRTFPIKGKYNNYGSIDGYEASQKYIDAWMEVFKEDLVEQGWGENTCHDVPTSRDMSFDKMLTALWEGRVKVVKNKYVAAAQDTDEAVPVIYGMIREDVWQVAVRMSDMLNRFMDHVKKTAESVMSNEHLKKNSLLIKAALAKDGVDLDQVLDNATLGYDFQHVPGEYALGEQFKCVVLNDHADAEFIRGVAEFLCISRLLHVLGIQWHHVSSTGPQFGEWRTHEKWTSALSNIAKGIADERESEQESDLVE